MQTEHSNKQALNVGMINLNLLKLGQNFEASSERRKQKQSNISF